MPRQDCSYSLDLKKSGKPCLSLEGRWIEADWIPQAAKVLAGLDGSANDRTLSLAGTGISDWDSTLLVFLSKIISGCRERGLAVEFVDFPKGVRRLLDLASAVPENKGARKTAVSPSFLLHVGDETISFARSMGELIDFLGETCLAVISLFRGRARYRQEDFMATLQECGINALPIVSMISFLVGLILAFVGAIQLEMFGAELYVADLVGIAMVRVMGAVMAGIIMAGRTGAAFAARIGTMEVNEEIDALKTLGINPVEYLVLPRVLGLTLMMPLLCIYADLMGILGGLVVGVGMLDLHLVEYAMETSRSVGLNDLWVGLFLSVAFGILVALTGCLRGMQCARSAEAVGTAATSAVVTGIVSIVVTTAVVTVACTVLGI
ncbi:MAG: ABC transporter permease [Desulfobacter sp.]|nr:ABC transporter permease [Desulfobacter sp.]